MSARPSLRQTARTVFAAAARFLASTILREVIRWFIDREFGDDE